MGVLFDAGSETNCRCALTSCVDTSIRYFLDAFEKLRFGDSGVAEEEDVDVASCSVHLSLVVFLGSSEEGEGDGLLHLIVSVDGGGDGVVDDLCQIGFFRELMEHIFLDV